MYCNGVLNQQKGLALPCLWQNKGIVDDSYQVIFFFNILLSKCSTTNCVIDIGFILRRVFFISVCNIFFFFFLGVCMYSDLYIQMYASIVLESLSQLLWYSFDSIYTFSHFFFHLYFIFTALNLVYLYIKVKCILVFLKCCNAMVKFCNCHLLGKHNYCNMVSCTTSSKHNPVN